MATPTPPGTPPPNPGTGRLLGTNNLGQQLDALTRAFTTFTNRFASQAGLGTLGMTAYGPMGGQTRQDNQLGRLQQQYVQGQSAHQVARQRMQDDLDRQQLVWDRQRAVGTRQVNDMRRPQWFRDESQMQLDINADSFVSSQRQTRDNWNLRDSQFTASQAQMTADMQRLRRQSAQQTTMNRVAFAGQVTGAVVGAARSYYSGGFEEQLGQFERRMDLAAPNWSGTAGRRAQSMGRNLKSSGAIMWASSNEDLYGGSTDITLQSASSQVQNQLSRASSAAYITPGLGMQGAAQMQQELGTGQAFYASQMFGLAPTRFAGGVQNSPASMALSLAQRVNSGGFGSLSSKQLHDQLMQGGSLSMSMANWSQAAGLSGQSLEAMRNQTELLRDLMNPEKQGLKGLSSDKALQLIDDAGKRTGAGDKARDTIKDYAPSIGGSYQDSQRYLQGLSREGHLPASASFLDAARASADTLADIKTLLQKAMGPFANWLGGLTGAYKAGGPVGGTVSRLKDSGKGATSGFIKGWNMGPNVIFGDSGAGTDQSSYAKDAWNWVGGLFGGDSGTPESKQGGAGAKKSDGAGVTGGGVAAAISFARAQVGDKYVMGATGPNAWDCSSLMQAAYRSVGVSLPRVTYDQIKKGVEVPIDDVKPGDLVFYKDLSHVGMYAGNGRVIEAANPGRGVVEGPMYSKFKRARRVLSGGMEATPSLSGAQDDPTASQSGGSGPSYAGAYGSVEEVDALAAALAGSGGGGGGGGGSLQSVSRTPSASQNEEASTGSGGKDTVSDTRANVKLGRTMAAKYGWTAGEFDDLYKLWMGESGWNTHADNPSSDAYGIPQAMSNIHKETATSAWRNSASLQIAWGLKYIKGRYGSPSKALSFWNSHNPHWYKDGAWEVPGQRGEGVDARLHGGEMVLEANAAHTVRQALLNQGLNPSSNQGTSAGGGAVTLSFGAGSVVVQMPSATAEGAKSAATSFVSYVAADDRIKSLMGGW
ncbi:C40 family peptidase [Actinacidiphila sp. ITFR-21]|uniref:C40 family peptidase n=1 Tax=Actinacidiphila sp. ITFR-21 TaxID=3075199 RepID=UPI00288A0499|nr:C40 family peptidase [Streptomyces sp. ITFR-21]WNI17615.1 C40 family peptidase [Streptomyces sp. ITFR-21]WNI17755.1 C40 family peptidase [Streptomyces sp. ITFR-21]